MASALHPDFAADLARQLGMTVTDTEVVCTGAAGVLYLSKDGDIRPLIPDDNNIPVVCKCEHEAAEIIEEYYKFLAVECARATVANRDLPYIPEAVDFHYVHTVDVEDTTRITPEAEAEAARVLAGFIGATR